jgi:hypothetical protein
MARKLRPGNLNRERFAHGSTTVKLTPFTLFHAEIL